MDHLFGRLEGIASWLFPFFIYLIISTIIELLSHFLPKRKEEWHGYYIETLKSSIAQLAISMPDVEKVIVGLLDEQQKHHEYIMVFFVPMMMIEETRTRLHDYQHNLGRAGKEGEIWKALKSASVHKRRFDIHKWRVETNLSLRCKIYEKVIVYRKEPVD